MAWGSVEIEFRPRSVMTPFCHRKAPLGFNDAFLWQNGVITDLGRNSISTEPHAINNLGQIVGTDNNHAFIYNGGTFSDLNTLIDPASGWTLSSASGINDLGQIVGSGTD